MTKYKFYLSLSVKDLSKLNTSVLMLIDNENYYDDDNFTQKQNITKYGIKYITNS